MSFANFHVEHLNPEEMTNAKLKIFLRLSSFFETTFLINGICGGIADITLKVQYNSNDQMCQLFASVSENTDDVNLTDAHSFQFSSEFDRSTKPVLNIKSGWQLIGRKTYYEDNLSAVVKIYDMTLELINDRTAPFKELYTDTDLIDFELRIEGSKEAVPVHRSVLAVSSPILKSMVQRNWNEAKQGHVTLPEVSKATLEHFKKYIYLRELPDSPMDSAKLLPMIYLMPELGRIIAIKIVDIFKPEDGWDWLETFVSNAVGHKAYILLAALFKNMNKDNVKALEEHFSKLSLAAA